MPESADASEQLKKETSRRLIRVFFTACLVGFPLLFVSLVVALIVPLCVRDLPNKLLSAKLTFMSLGLLFAILQVFLGVLLALVGITIDYDVDASVGSARVKLASASPGILLLLMGNVLFGFSLMRQSEVSQTIEEKTPAVSAKTDLADVDSSNGSLKERKLGQDGKGPE